MSTCCGPHLRQTPFSTVTGLHPDMLAPNTKSVYDVGQDNRVAK